MKIFVGNSKNVKTLDLGGKCDAKVIKFDTPETIYHLAFIGKIRILCSGLQGT